MRHLAACDKFDAQRALGREHKLVFRGLAIDEEFCSARLLVGDLCALAVALFADEEEQADVDTLPFQLLCGCDLRGDDALGVTRATAVNALAGFRRRNVWRHRVHVGGERQLRSRMFGMSRPNIAAISFDRHALNVVAELLQLAGEWFAHRGFLSGGGLDVDQLAGEGENIHVRRIEHSTTEAQRNNESVSDASGPYFEDSLQRLFAVFEHRPQHALKEQPLQHSSDHAETNFVLHNVADERAFAAIDRFRFERMRVLPTTEWALFLHVAEVLVQRKVRDERGPSLMHR